LSNFLHVGLKCEGPPVKVGSVRILRMRLTPTCGEGWRRLSLVLSALIAIGVFYQLIQKYNEYLANVPLFCSSGYQARLDNCPKPGPSQTCFDGAEKFLRTCMADAYPSLYQRLYEWGLRALVCVVVAFLMLYLVRLAGWIAAGFTKSASA
jgi:hypothetical protein